MNGDFFKSISQGNFETLKQFRAKTQKYINQEDRIKAQLGTDHPQVKQSGKLRLGNKVSVKDLLYLGRDQLSPSGDNRKRSLILEFTSYTP